MLKQPGTYVLWLKASSECLIEIGRLERFLVKPGNYFYVGSAFARGGVQARVSHHLKRSKKQHWHIDYLRAQTDVVAVWISYQPERLECRIADALAASDLEQPFRGFGSSDCACKTHLFFSAALDLPAAFLGIAEEFGLVMSQIWMLLAESSKDLDNGSC